MKLKNTKNKKKVSKSKFNTTNDSIEWAKWSWNPVTGCKYGCKYCYARDIANRFYAEGFEPTFHPERLAAPENTKIPKTKRTEPRIKNVFVCSMADLFGDWVPVEWIEDVLKACADNPQWNYIFLTKNPKRYLEFEFSKNCAVGATADTQERMDEAMSIFKEFRETEGYEKNKPITFLSCEPLKEPLDMTDWVFTYDEEKWESLIDWIIIGGQSSTTKVSAEQPEWEWVESLLIQAREIEIPVYFKTNLEVRPKECPDGFLS